MKRLIETIARVNKIDRFNAIINYLNSKNISYRIQELPFPNALGNIIVEVGDKRKSKTITSAHYDNVVGTPGANDNACACAIVLKLIDEFINTNKHMEFVLFDFEESGFLGSDYYYSNNKEKIELFINLDMCGLGEHIILSVDNLDEYRLNKTTSVINNYNAYKLNMLPPGDAYTFIHKHIPSIYIASSTTHDLPWFDSYSKGLFPRFNPDFLKTMHKKIDTIDTISIEQVNEIFNFTNDLLNEL